MHALQRIAGAALFIYAGVFALQMVVYHFYTEVYPVWKVWLVLDCFTAVGVVIALAVAWRHRGRVDSSGNPARWLAAQAAFYSTIVYALWFFSNWFNSLAIGLGEAQNDAALSLWHWIEALTVVVLGTTGAHLWNAARR